MSAPKGQLSFAEAPRSAQVVQLREPERRRSRKKLGVVDQIKLSFGKGSRLATSVGLVLGSFVPIGSFVVCHHELPVANGWRYAALLALIGGGLIFSGKSVFQWTSAAFGDRLKAAGFVVLVEGIMVLSQVPELSLSALALLVAVNGIASAAILGRDG